MEAGKIQITNYLETSSVKVVETVRIEKNVQINSNSPHYTANKTSNL